MAFAASTSEGRLHFPGFPKVKPSLLAFAVRIFGGGEGPPWRSQVASHIGQGFFGGVPVLPAPGVLEGLGIRHRQEGLVIEHFLKVGDKPAAVGGIPVEPETELVENPAAAHGLEGSLDHPEGPLIIFAFGLPEEKGQIMGNGELGGGTETSEFLVELAAQLGHGPLEEARRDLLSARLFR
jgi:hypothetical protein